MIFSLPLICLSFSVCKYAKWSAFSQLCSLIFYIYILKEVISEVLNIVKFHFNNYKLACMWEVIGAHSLVSAVVNPHWCVWFEHCGHWRWSHTSKLKMSVEFKTIAEHFPINNMRKPCWLRPSIWKCLRTFMEILSNWNTSWCN